MFVCFFKWQILDYLYKLLLTFKNANYFINSQKSSKANSRHKRFKKKAKIISYGYLLCTSMKPTWQPWMEGFNLIL